MLILAACSAMLRQEAARILRALQDAGATGVQKYARGWLYRRAALLAEKKLEERKRKRKAAADRRKARRYGRRGSVEPKGSPKQAASARGRAGRRNSTGGSGRLAGRGSGKAKKGGSSSGRPPMA